MRANTTLRPLMLRLPEDLRLRVYEQAMRDGVSVNSKLNELLSDSFLCDDCAIKKYHAEWDICDVG